MNSEPATAQIPDPIPEHNSPHSGNGKISRLPKDVRDQINNWILDGLSFPEIKERLGEQGKEISASNLSQYKKHSYQAWLKEKIWRDEIRARQESFVDLLRDTDATKLSEAGLQITATQICELLHDLQPLSARHKIEEEPDKYLRLVNALARISRVLIHLQQYRDRVAKEKAAEAQKLAAATRDPGNTHDIVLEEWREHFGHDLIEPSWRSKRFRSSPPPESSSLPADGTSSPPLEERTEERRPSAPNTDHSLTDNSHAAAALPLPPGEGRGEGNSEIETQNSKIEIPVPPSAPIKNQNSKIQNSELCFNCARLLPALLPNGRRPSHICPACLIRLPPPGSTSDRCQFCNTPQAILPSGERTSTHCRGCNNILPPPGQRFVEFCPNCGHPLPSPTQDGTSLCDTCPDCRTALPLLEPVPAPPSPNSAEQIQIA